MNTEEKYTKTFKNRYRVEPAVTIKGLHFHNDFVGRHVPLIKFDNDIRKISSKSYYDSVKLMLSVLIHKVCLFLFSGQILCQLQEDSIPFKFRCKSNNIKEFHFNDTSN